MNSFFRTLRKSLVRINLLHILAGLDPWTAFLTSFLVGLTLAVASSVLGVGFFWATIEIYHAGGVEQRTLHLGYLDQVNYGLWYLMFCPFLFVMIAAAYRSTERVSVRSSQFLLPWNKLRHSWITGAFGLILLVGFVGKNVWVERNDYKNLGLGWVQARILQDYRNQIQSSGPIDLTAAGKRFDQFLLTKKHEYITREKIEKVVLVDVDPNLRVRSDLGMIAFIVVTKVWVGLWEALVMYVAMLTFLWGRNALEKIDVKNAISEDKKKYGVAWLFRPAFYLLAVGVLVNLFSIFRFCGNAIKGSYGNWDQYWSLLTFSPATIVIVLGCFILSKIHIFPQLEHQTYLPRNVAILFAFWFSSTLYIIYLLLGYIHPQDQEVLVMCFRPFTELLKKLFG